MALRSFSAAKSVSALIANEISTVVARRGFAAAATQGAASTTATGAPNVVPKKGSKESPKNSWGPDPVTGYYRPDGQSKDVDAAELREMHVENKSTAQ